MIGGLRIVHARSAAGAEVVRYDRAGRWFIEEPGLQQRLRTVQQAVDEALRIEEQGGQIFPGRPGGLQFDVKVSGARAKKARHSKT